MIVQGQRSLMSVIAAHEVGEAYARALCPNARRPCPSATAAIAHGLNMCLLPANCDLIVAVSTLYLDQPGRDRQRPHPTGLIWRSSRAVAVVKVGRC